MNELREGKSHESHIHKANGTERTVKSEYKPNGHFAKQADTTGLEAAYVNTGRTVELAPYEFARMDISMKVHFSDDEDAVYEAMIAVVTELARREEVAVAGRDVDPLPIPIDAVDLLNNECVARSISVSYGLTLKGRKRFESHKIDISQTRQLDDGESIIPAFEKLGADVGAKIGERREKIQGGDERTGL